MVTRILGFVHVKAKRTRHQEICVTYLFLKLESRAIQRCSMQPTVKWLYMGSFLFNVLWESPRSIFYFLWGSLLETSNHRFPFSFTPCSKNWRSRRPKMFFTLVLVGTWRILQRYQVMWSRVFEQKGNTMTRVGKKTRHALEQVRDGFTLCSVK